MPNQSKSDQDRRVKRTKFLVFEAFFEMVQSTRYDEFKTKDIIEKAGIGRSTFYEHFFDKDDVLSQSLESPMLIIAKALISQDDDEDLLRILTHFWERRIFARVILKHPTREVVNRCLQKLISSNLDEVTIVNERDRLAHISFLSSGFLSLLNDWLSGKLRSTEEEMCKYIKAYSFKK